MVIRVSGSVGGREGGWGKLKYKHLQNIERGRGFSEITSQWLQNGCPKKIQTFNI